MKKFTTNLENICLIEPVETEEPHLKKLVFIPHDPMWEEEAAERRKQHSQCIKIGNIQTLGDSLNLYKALSSQNNREYKLDDLLKENGLDFSKGKLPFDILPCVEALPILERTSHTTSNGKRYIGYKNVGFIPHSMIGNVSNLSMMMDMAIRRLAETTPELLGGTEPKSFAIRAVDGRLVSFDYVDKSSLNGDSVKIDSLSMHPNVDSWMANDDFVMSIKKNDVHLTYTTLGGHIGTLGDIEFWERKDDASYEVGAKAKKKNVKNARKAVSGKTAAGALFKSLLGSKK